MIFEVGTGLDPHLILALDGSSGIAYWLEEASASCRLKERVALAEEGGPEKKKTRPTRRRKRSKASRYVGSVNCMVVPCDL